MGGTIALGTTPVIPPRADAPRRNLVLYAADGKRHPILIGGTREDIRAALGGVALWAAEQGHEFQSLAAGGEYRVTWKVSRQVSRYVVEG